LRSKTIAERDKPKVILIVKNAVPIALILRLEEEIMRSIDIPSGVKPA